MKLYVSKPGAYPLKPRYIMRMGDYDKSNILYSEGYSMGNSILFDSRQYAMPIDEFQSNFEPMEADTHD